VRPDAPDNCWSNCTIKSSAKRSELEGYRAAIDKITAIPFDQGRPGVSLGLDVDGSAHSTSYPTGRPSRSAR
jgi:hypothetical protein